MIVVLMKLLVGEEERQQKQTKGDQQHSQGA